MKKVLRKKVSMEKILEGNLERKVPKQPKRHRSTDDFVYIYDDEFDYPTRMITERPSYNAYCKLWGEFIELLTVVRWADKPELPKKDSIPRIELKRIELEQKKKNNDEEITKIQTKIKENMATISKVDTKDVQKRALELENNQHFENIRILEIQTEKANTEKSQLDNYTKIHVAQWNDMERVIEDLSHNEYVKRRNPHPADLRAYTNALYDMILK